MRALALTVAVLLAHAALAAPSDRELDGHRFIPSLVVIDPFVTTEVALVTGAGAAFTSAPAVDETGAFGTRASYLSSAIATSARFQARLTRLWALRLGIGAGLFAGATPKAALALGATSTFQIAPGTTLSVQLGRHLRLGGTFDFFYATAQTIDPRAAVQGSIATGRVDRSAIRTRLNSYQIVPGVSLAYAPHPAFGLVAIAQYTAQIYAEQDPDTSDNVHNLAFGLSAQLDLAPLTARAPIAIVAGYRVVVPLRSAHLVTHDLEGGLYYSGLRALSLGLTATARWFDLRPEAPPGFAATAILGSLVLRSYFP